MGLPSSDIIGPFILRKNYTLGRKPLQGIFVLQSSAMNTFLHVFAYLNFAAAVAVSIPAVIALVQTKTATGAALLSAVEPAISAFQPAFGHTIPQDKALAIANAVADALKAF